MTGRRPVLTNDPPKRPHVATGLPFGHAGTQGILGDCPSSWDDDLVGATSLGKPSGRLLGAGGGAARALMRNWRDC